MLSSPDPSRTAAAGQSAAAPPLRTRFRLLRYFAAASVAAFVVFAIALAFFEYTERAGFERAQQEQNAFFAQLQDKFVQRHDAAANAYLVKVYEAGNANLARLFSNTLWTQDFAPFVASAQRIPADRCRAMTDEKDAGGKTVPTRGKRDCFAEIGRDIMALPGFNALDAKLFETMKKTSVFKIKLFDRRGITIYSTEHSQVGEDRRGTVAWESAIAGKPMSQLSFRDKFTAIEGVVTNRDLVSSYLPLYDPRGGDIVGVFEVYSDVTQFLAQIRSTSAEISKLIAANQAQFEQAAAASQGKADTESGVLFIATFALLALLYLVLFLIVRNAQRTIDRQEVERRRADADLTRQKDLYAMLSQTNKAIVRISKREDLYAVVCRLAVEHGRFRFAWIGLRDKSDPRVKVAARFGEDAGYVDRVLVSAESSAPRGLGPSGQALRAGKHAVSNDFLNDPATAPWHEAARIAGVRASAAFPILEHGEPIGTLNVYAGDTGYFTPNLIATLDEIAMDISFALENMARETARLQAVEALRTSEERFRNLLRDAPSIAVQGYGMDGITRYWNQASERLYGYTAREAIGRPLLELIIPPEMRIGVAEAMRQMAETGQAIPASELSLMRKDGSRVDVFSSHAMVRIPGQAPELFCIDVDLTETKRAARAVKESEEKYRRIFDSLQDVYIETGPDGIIRDISTEIEALSKSQYRREDLIGTPVSDLYADTQRRDALLQALKQHRRAIDFEADLKNRDGSIVPCSISATVAINADGKPAGLSAMVRDISERKRAERDREEASVQFRAIVEQSIAGITIIQDRKFAYLNPRLCEIHGYTSSQELVGTDPISVTVEEDRPAVTELIRRLIDGEIDRINHTLTGLRKDGSRVDLGISSARISFLGRPAIMGMVQDISEKKRAQEQIERYVAQLGHAFMSTVEVAMNMGEMRDPYTAGHERRVAEISIAIGAELGFDERRLEGLRVAGYLHDLGKITVPSEILAKPGKLTAAEYNLIQGHPQASYDVIKDVDFPWPVAQIVWQHHERMDGSGYPRGLKGEAILLEARILSVADVVEAMSSHRPYRAGLGIDKALAEIARGRGSAYDPQVADACLKLFREKGYAIPV